MKILIGTTILIAGIGLVGGMGLSLQRRLRNTLRRQQRIS